MEPGETFNTWAEFRAKLDAFCLNHKVYFTVSNGKTVEQSNSCVKKGPLFDTALKYVHVIMRCKHFGSYTSSSAGCRPKQRSYKINCRSFISLSACRKENYLIIRDAYHKHSHPCTEEIYNSYPEVRRLSKEERRMVGTLMDMGVSVNQIKAAVGRNVTQKDLHNAKVHMRAVRMGLKSDEPKKRQRKNQHADSETNTEESCVTPSCSHESDIVESVEVSIRGNEEQVSTSTEITGDKMEESNSDLTNCDNPSNEDHVYTVVVSTADDDKSNSHSLNQLQQLLERHNTEASLQDGVPTELSKTEIMEQIEKQLQAGALPAESGERGCEECGAYMSPSDGHSLCLTCLGPEHLHEYECKHCVAMRPEQLGARRKSLVKMRMKTLKNNKKLSNSSSNSYMSPPSNSNSNDNIPVNDTTQRRSKRGRKPRNFGDDMAVEDIFSHRTTMNSQSTSTRNLKSRELGHCFPKREIEDDDYYEDTSFEADSSKTQSKNTDRFNHILRQSAVFDDVLIKEMDDGGLEYEPDVNSIIDINKVMTQKEMTSIPTSLNGKYNLDSQFESSYCSVPSAFDVPGDGVVNAMGSGLRKLVQNATVQTRLAIYDKLFTRLGVGMADEALDIITQLYGKVTNVTEISQDDLTHNLQMVLDTIQALKDVLEELGDMSKDSLSTACHQRKISIHSLERAKATLKMKRPASSHTSLSPVKRGKFTPFTKQRLAVQLDSDVEVATHLSTGLTDCDGLVSKVKEEAVVSSDSTAEEPQEIVMEVAIPSDMTLNDELLEQLRQQHKDGVLEVNVVKPN